MKAISYIFAGLFIASILIFSSCDKEEKVEQKLHGTWDVINVINYDDSVKYRWTFSENTLTVSEKHLDSTQWVISQQGTYLIDTYNFKRNTITFSGFVGIAISGEYKILKNNEDFLIIIREEPGLWKYVEMTAV